MFETLCLFWWHKRSCTVDLQNQIYPLVKVHVKKQLKDGLRDKEKQKLKKSRLHFWVDLPLDTIDQRKTRRGYSIEQIGCSIY
jgi:hypothetical protein